jgi:hypothetical protein
VLACACAIVCVCLRACAAALCAYSRGTAATCGIYGSARDACAARAVDLRALAAGAVWRCRTASAPWAGRDGHTTVIDAAGAIYVIGGYSSSNGTVTFYHDLWVSTDGGARPDSVGGGRGGGTAWVLQGVLGGLGCTRGLRHAGVAMRDFKGPRGVVRGTEGALGA